MEGFVNWRRLKSHMRLTVVRPRLTRFRISRTDDRKNLECWIKSVILDIYLTGGRYSEGALLGTTFTALDQRKQPE